ncbi:uncharacterized protein VTP21DRAFT_989 [Calcarisporiella thermophila]|uniref:uncharacterized protein n=1 Tax=Calcarisporiella thermophila TaxID=911321 RepID=UPI0037438125
MNERWIMTVREFKRQLRSLRSPTNSLGMASPSPKSLQFFTVDAFASSKGVFSGNPAGVALIPKDVHLPDATLQSIAAEVNLAETAFVTPLDGETFETATHFSLRWFTPTVEVVLCGHATLATTHVILNNIKNPASSVSFATLSGTLVGNKDPKTNLINITLPQNPSAELEQTPELTDLLHTLYGENLPKIVALQYNRFLKFLLIHMEGTETDLRVIKPDFKQMLEVSKKVDLELGAIIVTVKADEENLDMCSRLFGPWFGIDEDPVTGAAHTLLGPYWGNILGKTTLSARQCSPRTGEMEVTLAEKDGKEVAILAGKSVTVIEGVIHI